LACLYGCALDNSTIIILPVIVVLTFSYPHIPTYALSKKLLFLTTAVVAIVAVTAVTALLRSHSITSCPLWLVWNDARLISMIGRLAALLQKTACRSDQGKGR
jgi:hypothetical protein